MTTRTPSSSLTAGMAIRRLFARRTGLLGVLDPSTGRSAERPVMYRPQRDGSLIACLSNADDLLDAIHGGGEVVLTIPAVDGVGGGSAADRSDASAAADDGLAVIVDVVMCETRDARVSSLSQPLAELWLRIRDIHLRTPPLAS